MSMQWQILSYPMFGGVDTKFNGHILQAPKLQLCTNVYADKTGRIRKREGRSVMPSTELDGTTIDSLIAMGMHGDRLLGLGAIKGYEFSNDAQRWIDKGPLTSIKVSHKQVTKGTTPATSIIQCDSATVNNITAYVYLDASADVRMTVIDESGTVIDADRVLTLTGSTVRAVAHSGKLYLFYWESSVTDIMVKIIDPTSASTLNTSLAAAAVQVTTDADTAVIYDATSSTGNGVFLAYRTSAGAPGVLKWGFVSSTGVLANTSTIATPAVLTGIACDAHSAGAVHGIVGHVNTTPNDGYSWIQTWSGSAWTATATAATTFDTALAAIMTQVACKFDSATVLRIWWSGDAEAGNTTENREKTVTATHTTGNVVTTRITTSRLSQLASKPFVVNGRTYIAIGVGKADGIQSTLFLLDNDTVSPVAVVLQDTAFYGENISGWHTTVSVVGSTARFTCISKTRVGDDDDGNALLDSALGVMSFDLEFSHDASHRMVTIEGTTYMAGGFLQEYDGVSFTESGFLRFCEPSLCALTPAAGGSMTASSTYFYQFIPEWWNANGQRVRGTNSGAKSVALAAGQTQVTINIPAIIMTLKQASKTPARHGLVIGIYRTLSGAGAEAPFYRVGEVNNANVDELNYVDQLSDILAQDEELLYLGTGELDNAAPPSAHIMTQGAGRIFLAGGPDDSEVLASKLHASGETVAFNEALIIKIPDFGGKIVALEFLNELLVVFKERAIYRLRPTGVNNLGEGEFGEPELISADTGATNQRGVVLMPMGVMFTSLKGIYLLDQAFQVHYIGAPVEGFYPTLENGIPTPLSAALLPQKQQVRFSLGGNDLVYDYFHKQWYVYTYNNAISGPAAVWNNSYVAPYGAQNSWREDFTLSVLSYLDLSNSYQSTVRLAWLRSPSTLQGEVRVRRLGLLAINAATGGSLRVKVYDDYDESVAVQTITETNLATTGVVARQWRLDNQRVASMMIEFDDIGSAVDLRLSEIAFEVGVKTGFEARS